MNGQVMMIMIYVMSGADADKEQGRETSASSERDHTGGIKNHARAT